MGFSYYRPCSCDHTQCGSSDSALFPVMVFFADPTIRDQAHGGNVNSSSGADILFFSDLGFSQLNSEIEFYDNVNGILWAWVQVPLLSYSVNTVFYMFYGNASPLSRVTDPWDVNFVGVYHFPNGSSLTVNDSSGNGFNGTNTNATATAGVVDGAALFDGSTAFVAADALAGNTAIQSGSFTISAWINFTSTFNSSAPAVATVLKMGDAASNNDLDLLFDNTTGKAEFAYDTNSGFQIIEGTTTSWTAGVWYYYVGVLNAAGNSTLYINAAVEGTPIAAVARGTTLATHFHIGNSQVAPGRFFPGKIDEVRMESINRSADWITASYNNQKPNSTFLSIGSQQPQLVSGLVHSGPTYVFRPKYRVI